MNEIAKGIDTATERVLNHRSEGTRAQISVGPNENLAL